MSGDPRAPFEAALADRYRIERELGRGGMATVYLVSDLRHDRPVALKVLHPSLAASLGPERFLREIKLAARLQHPHILTVLDSGESAGQLWFTMPFIEGESLRDRLNREKQLPVEDALRIAREAADALEYAHQHGVIHRDIKPENILLSTGHALVADFGIARALGGSEHLTETGMAVGTPAYMSPEQAAGERELDARTDVYSLGTVLYEMLAGEPPFTGPTAQAIAARRLTGEAPSVRRYRSAVPEQIEQAVRKSLAAVPADRFSSAGEFARALAQTTTVSTVSVPAAPTVVAPTMPRRSHRHRSSVLLGLGFLLGLGVLFGWLRGRHGGEAAPGGAAGEAKRLAVLPFDNLGAADDEYFADGITDEIRGKLAAIPGLQVTASRSAAEYKKSSKDLATIARELGVDYLLVGKVRWEKGASEQSRVRVSPELIQVSTGSTKWQQPFDANLTDVFQVQADVAGRVAQALDVALGAGQKQALAERPTGNLAAYDAYLKGLEAAGLGGNPSTLRQAIDHFERAIALDTAFAPAWARLSDAASLLLGLTAPSSAHAARALFAANRALALAPDRPEGHVALGNYYRRVDSDYQRAVQAYDAGQSPRAPNAELLRGKGIAEEALGRYEASAEHLRQAWTLDPRSSVTANVYAGILRHLRRYGEALEADDRAIALAPTNLQALQGKILTLIARGDLNGARAALQTPPAGVDLTAMVAYMGTFNELYWALPKEQQDLMLRLPPSAFDDDRGSWGLALAGLYWLRGDDAKVRVYGDSARMSLEEQSRSAPENGQTHVLLGTALAYAGRKADAIREGLKGVELMPISKDASTGPYVLHQLLRIYLVVGEREKALDELEKLLGLHYDLSPGWLRIDPTFDPLRKNPRFLKLVEGGS